MDPEKPKNDISKDEETIKQPDSTENAPPIESRIGLGIVNAADRINKLLNNAAERREQSTETLKEVGSTVIAYLRKGVENGALYVLGASVVAGEAVEDTKDKVVSTVKGGVEATKSYFGEKVGSIRKAIQERRENALERKNLRASKREQRANEKKLDALKRETSDLDIEQNDETDPSAERREQSTETLKEVGSTVIAYLRKGVENGALYVLGASVVAGEAVEDTKDKVVSTVKGGVEATKSYFGEKVGSIRKAIQERRENALERKNLRASKREQRANEKKLDALKRETSAIEQEQKNNKIYAEIALRKSEAKDRKLARRTKHIEEFQDKLKIGKERLKSIGRSALEIINRAKATGQAAYSAWESYTPPTV